MELRHLRKLGITLKPDYESDNLTSTMSLVASTGGVTVLPIYARHVLSPSVAAAERRTANDRPVYGLQPLEHLAAVETVPSAS